MNKEQWQLTIYIPKGLRQERLLERLRKLARQRRRSLNFLVLERLLLDNSGNSLLKLGELAALAGLSVEQLVGC
jgi:hypothetical protein